MPSMYGESGETREMDSFIEIRLDDSNPDANHRIESSDVKTASSPDVKKANGTNRCKINGSLKPKDENIK